MALRIIFMGTPDFSVPSLNSLVEAGHELVACYSQPPRPAGRRGLEVKKSPVHESADAHGIPVFTPLSLKEVSDQTIFAKQQADVAVVIAYGLLLPKVILKAPRLGCFNGHASLLPRWRGAAPIQRAIMAGDKKTGVNIMKMDIGLDTGPIALGETVAINDDMTTGLLHDRLSEVTARLMIEAMQQLEAGSLTVMPQSQDGVTYAKKIEKFEARIDWHRPAQAVHNHIRGLSPFPGSWCEMMIGGKLQRVKVLNSAPSTKSGNPGEIINDDLTIACETGAVQLLQVQRAGKQVQDKQEFLRGNSIDAVL
ncbi:MAG: methionyl-tRNA formyltransferase [Pseudomonadota bacterium]